MKFIFATNLLFGKAIATNVCTNHAVIFAAIKRPIFFAPIAMERPLFVFKRRRVVVARVRRSCFATKQLGQRIRDSPTPQLDFFLRRLRFALFL